MHNFSISDNSAQIINPAFPAGSNAPETPVKPIVCIVGTDAETRLLYRVFLESWDFDAVEADGFEELFPIVEYSQPALILMDGSLSSEENLQTIRQIRGNRWLEKTPLVLTSGHSQAKARELALRSGADDYLVKPLNFDELQNKLRRNIEKSGSNAN